MGTRVPFTPDILSHTNNSIEKVNLSLDFSPRVSESTVYKFLDVFPKWLQHFSNLKHLEVQVAVRKPAPWADGYYVHIGKVFAETQARVCRFDELVGGKGEFVSRDTTYWRFSDKWCDVENVVVENWEWMPLKAEGAMDWSKVPAEAFEALEALEVLECLEFPEAREASYDANFPPLK